MPQPTGPKDPLQPPPPGIPAIETQEADWELNALNQANDDSLAWHEVAIRLAKQLWSPDDVVANLKTEYDDVVKGLAK
jgi:hypothetical protein